MVNDIDVTVVGNVVSDVRHLLTQSGVPVASFRLASTSRRFDREQGRWVDGDVTFFTVNCWRGLADNVAASMGKGDPVMVIGRLRTRDWERGDKRGMSVEIEAASVGHDLCRGVSTFDRVRRTPPVSAAGASPSTADPPTAGAESTASSTAA